MNHCSQLVVVSRAVLSIMEFVVIGPPEMLVTVNALQRQLHKGV